MLSILPMCRYSILPQSSKPKLPECYGPQMYSLMLFRKVDLTYVFIQANQIYILRGKISSSETSLNMGVFRWSKYNFTTKNFQENPPTCLGIICYATIHSYYVTMHYIATYISCTLRLSLPFVNFKNTSSYIVHYMKYE